MPNGPKRRSERVKAEELARVAKGEAALALEPGERSAAIRKLVAQESEAFLECPFTGSVELGVSRLAGHGRFVAACPI